MGCRAWCTPPCSDLPPQGQRPGLEHIDAADQNEWCIVGKTNGAEVDAAGSHGFKLLCTEAYGFFRNSLHLSHSVMQVDDDGTEFSFATTVFSEPLKCADRKLGKVVFDRVRSPHWSSAYWRFRGYVGLDRDQESMDHSFVAFLVPYWIIGSWTLLMDCDLF